MDSLNSAFFGSFRLGEILCPNEKNFNSFKNLLWEDLTFRNDGSILIKIKVPKSRQPQGEFIDIFPFKGHNCCPAAALRKLKNLRADPEFLKKPVFMFKNGVFVTPSLINKILPKLLENTMGKAAQEYLGHSLRPALASAMANDPLTARDQELKKWGRWNSSSYLLYTRLKLNQKKYLFSLISNVLNKQ